MNHNVRCLPKDGQAAFARTLEVQSAMTWGDIKRSPRHANGSESIPKSQIRPSIPEPFSDQNEFLAIRYWDNRPMVGVRTREVFHVLWVESNYGDVYRHSH